MCTGTEKTSPTPTGPPRENEICPDGLAYYAAALRGHIPSPATTPCPPCLLDLGLIRRLPDGTLTPLPPHLAAGTHMDGLERAIAEKRHALDTLRTSISRAQEVYLDSTGREDTLAIRTLHGPATIATTVSAAVRACRTELLTAQPGGGRPQAVLDAALPVDLAALNRGVHQRTVYEHTVRTHPPTLDYAAQITRAGGEVRTLDEVFDRLIICDRRIAFVPDPAAERSEIALVIEHPGVVRYLAGFFDHAWQRATPLRDVSGGRLPAPLTDDIRRTILRHMVNGHTDEAIAARLGMSTRSVANHMRWAADLFGSRSRAQLAYLIARNNFLDP
ncbi:LuxR C-terminal-related transcriptional regulator [Streptomyces sp. NPDC047014]|uniref:LuxR C-terminal-related transcriptional regulator n=1 Tax=Streptomyces sp. NPDC047014 TaxID=3155736 RepID=UPI0033E3ADFE